MSTYVAKKEKKEKKVKGGFISLLGQGSGSGHGFGAGVGDGNKVVYGRDRGGGFTFR